MHPRYFEKQNFKYFFGYDANLTSLITLELKSKNKSMRKYALILFFEWDFQAKILKSLSKRTDY